MTDLLNSKVLQKDDKAERTRVEAGRETWLQNLENNKEEIELL